MGTHIRFSSASTDLGSVYFSAFTAMRQRSAYGMDYIDCVTYGPDGDDESIGHPRGNETRGKYRPRIARGIRRAETLLGKIREYAETHGKPRTEREREDVEELLRLLRVAKEDRSVMVRYSD